MQENSDVDEKWMFHALSLADKAEEAGEIPVGALVVANAEIISEGWNTPISENDPSAHAEMKAIRAAALALNNYRLINTTLYVTLEPCAMCAGLLVHARIKRVVFGAFDPKSGAGGSVLQLLQHPSLNHSVEVTGGVLADECAHKLSAFFKRRRAEIKQQKRARQTS